MIKKVGDDIVAENANWTFGGDVADSFDSHVEKSIPFYHEGHDLVAQLSDFFLHNGSTCYEIGCSTGALIERLARRVRPKDVKFIGIDVEHRMAEKARGRWVASEDVV